MSNGGSSSSSSSANNSPRSAGAVVVAAPPPPPSSPQESVGSVRPPPPPPPPAAAEVVSVRRKRAADPGASGSKVRKYDGHDVASPCSVCGKRFGSWKALFGHMRSHPERSWRGVHPPPVFNREGSPEPIVVPADQQPPQGGGGNASATAAAGAPLAGGQQQGDAAAYLLRLANQVKSNLEKESVTVGAEAAGSPPQRGHRRGLSIDLNEPHNPESPSENGQTRSLDLNFPPPPEKKDD